MFAAERADRYRLLLLGALAVGLISVWGAVEAQQPAKTGAAAPAENLPPGAVARFGSTAFKGPLGTQTFAFSPDGKRLAAGANNRVDVFDVSTGKRILRLDEHNGKVHKIAFSADGKTLYSCDGDVTYWDVRTGRVIRKIELGSRVGQLKLPLAAVSADRQWIVTRGSDKMLRLWKWGETEAVVSMPDEGAYIRSIALSDDGKLVATGENQGKCLIRVLDAQTLKQRFAVGGHKRAVRALIFSRDGRVLFSGGVDGSIRRWDTTTGRQLAPVRKESEKNKGSVMSLALSRGGGTLAVGESPNAVSVIDVASGKTRFHSKRLYDFVRAVAFSPDTKTLVASGGMGALRLWDMTTGKPLDKHLGHAARVVDMTISNNGKLLATLGYEGRVCVWDVVTRKLKQRSQFVVRRASNPHDRIAFTADGTQVAVTRGGRQVLRWDYNLQKLPTALPKTQVSSSVVALSRTGAIARPEGDGTISVRPFHFWSGVYSTQKPVTLRGQRGSMTTMTFSDDGSVLAAASTNKTICLWDLKTGQQTRELTSDSLIAVTLAMSADGTLLAAASAKTIEVWNPRTGERLQTFRNLADSVPPLAISPDNNVLASFGAVKMVRLWSLGNGKQIALLAGHERGVRSLAFSSNGKLLASGGVDKTVRVFDVAESKERAKLSGHNAPVTSLRFLKDDKWIASGSQDGEVIFWDIQTGKQLARKSNIRGGVVDLAVSLDGRYLAAAARDRTVRRLSVEQLDHPGSVTLLAQFGIVHDFAFSPDGRSLAIVRRTGVQVFNTADDSELGAVPIDGVTSATFSPDGQTLILLGKEIVAWSLKSKSAVYRIPADAAGKVYSMALSPDGTTLATTTLFARDIRLWNALTGRFRGRFSAGKQTFRRIAFTADGRMLAAMTGKGVVSLFEVVTGKELHRLPQTDPLPNSFCLADDNLLMTGMRDGTTIAWNLLPTDFNPQRLIETADAKTFERLWSELQSDDGSQVYRSIWSLSTLKDRAVEFLRQRVMPAPGRLLPAERIEALIVDLNNENPTVRRQASSRLRKLGPFAEPVLRKALARQTAPRVRNRIELLLVSKLRAATKSDVTSIRAVQVLERIGTHKARTLLKSLADGNPVSLQTIEAGRALKNLSRRTDSKH